MNPTANGTFQELAIEWYNEVSNASDTNDLGQGIYDIFNKPTNDKFQWRSPWPRDDATKEFKIRYCYMDGASKSSIMAHFEEAIIKILANMGGQPSQATGYGIRFEETVIDGKYEFCRDPNPNNNLPEKFNPRINAKFGVNVLAVESIPGKSQQTATYGFFTSNPPTVIQNRIRIDRQNVHAIMHELMHVLG